MRRLMVVSALRTNEATCCAENQKSVSDDWCAIHDAKNKRHHEDPRMIVLLHVVATMIYSILSILIKNEKNISTMITPKNPYSNTTVSIIIYPKINHFFCAIF